jgi:hypothetical protein
MVFWTKCPKCEELFESQEEMEKHIVEDHLELSQKSDKVYMITMDLFVVVGNTDEAEKIADFIVNIDLPKVIAERIKRWTYADETGLAMIEEVSDVDWRH